MTLSITVNCITVSLSITYVALGVIMLSVLNVIAPRKLVFLTVKATSNESTKLV